MERTNSKCFGDRDVIFAGHPSDERQAKKLIKEAISDGATQDEFKKELIWHVYKNVPNVEYRNARFEEVEKRLSKMWLLEVDPQSGGFRRNADNPLDCDLLVVDEASPPPQDE